MSKASVLMVLSHYRGFGGHEAVIENLCNGIASMGYDVAIGAFSFAREPPGNIRSERLSRLRGLRTRSRFDIIHGHQTSINYYSLTANLPYLLHWHGASSLTQELNLKFSMSLCRSKIGKIIGISNAAMQQVKNLVGDVPHEIVHNGVDSTFFTPQQSTPYKIGDPQLFFVGNFYPHKNVMFLVDAMVEILKKYPSAHLQIAGKGSDCRNIEARIKSLGLEKSVELVGQPEPEELRLRYASCDIYISASKWEMFDLPALEAMACAKPVLLSDIAAHTELAELSQSGTTFPLSSGAQGILEGLDRIYDQQKAYGNAGRQYAEKNDWKVVSTKMARIYEAVLQT